MADLWSESEVLGLVDSIVNDPPFYLRDVEYDVRRELLFQQRFVSIPGVTVDAAGRPRTGMVQFRSPEIEDHANKFKNRMLASPVKINVAAVGKGQQKEASAQRQEDFFYRHYYRWRDQGVFDGVLFDQASVGIGWFRLAINTDLLPIVPEYSGNTDEFFQMAEDELKEFTSGEKKDLFVAERIDPATMYWNPDRSILIQKALVPVNPLVERYGRKGKQIDIDDETGDVIVTSLQPGQNFRTRRINWTRQVYLYTLETSDYCYHAIAGQKGGNSMVIGAYRNYFGEPGFIPVIGERTGSEHPLFAYRPMLNGKYQTVPVKNILRTAMVTAGAEGAQQRYALRWLPGQGPEPPDNTNIRVEVTDDGVIVPPPGYELVNSGLSVGPDVPAALMDVEKSDTYGYPVELSRPSEMSAASGYDRARQQDAVASLLDPPLAHFAVGLEQACRMLLNAVKEIGLPVTVRSLQAKPTAGRAVTLQKETTLNPEDVIDSDISVSFNSVTVFSRIAMQEEGLKLMQADQMDETQFQTEVMGVDNLQEFRDQRATDKVLKAADDRAVADAIKTMNLLADMAQQKALTDNGLPNPQQEAPPMVPTNGEMLRSDRGPGQPIGPGVAMPAGGQTPPAPAELGAPVTPVGANG